MRLTVRAKLAAGFGFVILALLVASAVGIVQMGSRTESRPRWRRTPRCARFSANDRYQGDYERALREITAATMVMPGRTDLYFPPEDSMAGVELLPNAELRVIPSVWGHYAGGGRDAADTAFINDALLELLAR